MTSEAPGQPSPGKRIARRSAPTVTIGRTALRANAMLWAGRGRTASLSAALSHDAWGHGAAEVEAALRAAGAERQYGEPAASAALVAKDPSDDLGTLFGLPGSSGRPVMRLSGAVLGVKTLRAGEGVSYGYTHHATVDTNVALVTGGYAQGVVRALGNHIDVAIGVSRHRVVGRVAMDVCVVDVGDARVRRGDEVVFFGDANAGEPSLAEWSDISGLTAAEIVTMVGQRAAREVVA